MPHTGKPSGACQNCKQRHVKCDETRPACLKCIKSKRICPGYIEGLDLVLRDQNQIAKAGAERRQKARDKSRSKTPESSSEPASPDSLIVYSSVPESQESYAQTFFISAYVLAPRDGRTDHGFLELLPLMFNKLSKSSVLSTSLSVVSHCFFQAWQPDIRNIDHVVVQKIYSKALNALQAALRDPRQCESDEVLMAVSLLSFYEYTVSAVMSRPRAEQHIEGISALVKRRGSTNMRSDLAKRLLIAARNSIVSKALANSMAVEQVPEIWDDPGEMPKNPATLLTSICLEAANVLATAAKYPAIPSSGLLHDEVVSNMLFSAEAVEAKFAAWQMQVPAEWWPTTLSRDSAPQEIIDAGFLGDSCDIYSDTSVCDVWNSFRTTRLRVLSLIADYDLTDSRQSTVMQIQQTVDEIFASIPFMLGSKVEPAGMYETEFVYPSLPGENVSMIHYQKAAATGGLTLFTPLMTLFSFMRYLRGDQKQFALQQFRRLGCLYDVRMDAK
ncbi:MAG: hypothetical protein Q9174_003376 [Haloplaca sp. 1 TL-2023]